MVSLQISSEMWLLSYSTGSLFSKLFPEGLTAHLSRASMGPQVSIIRSDWRAHNYFSLLLIPKMLSEHCICSEIWLKTDGSVLI